MSDIVPSRNELSRQGVRGVIAAAGGIGALILAGIGGWAGIIVGGALAIIGIALSGGKKERTAGLVTAGLGGAVLVSSLPVLHGLVGGLFHWVMRVSGIILLGIGGFSLFKFFSGLRKRT
jgi:hypothetical protein